MKKITLALTVALTLTGPALAQAPQHVAQIAWTPSPTPGATSGNVLRCDTPPCTAASNWKTVNTVPVVSPFVDSTVAIGPHQWAVTAILNGAESIKSLPSNVMTIPPAAPLMSATGSVLSWKDTNPAGTTYNVLRGATVIATAIPAQTFDVSAQVGVFAYTVVPTFNATAGDVSNTVTVTVAPQPPQPPGTVTVTIAGLTVTLPNGQTLALVQPIVATGKVQ